MAWIANDLWNDKDAIFLITAMPENERFAKELVEAQASQFPAQFDGISPIVYQKFLYVPPFEHFKELHRLEMQIQKATGLRAYYRGAVAIDLSEWFGHEDEEYLSITFKYLHDHRKYWKILFLVGSHTISDIIPMVQTVVQYLCLGFQQICLFQDFSLLKNYIEYSVSVTPQAAFLLAKIFQNTSKVQNYVLLNQILSEISIKAAENKIDCNDLKSYFSDDCSLFSLINGKPFNIDINENVKEE